MKRAAMPKHHRFDALPRLDARALRVNGARRDPTRPS